MYKTVYKNIELISLILTCLSLFICTLLAGDLYLSNADFVISDYGVDSRSGLFFNLSLVILGLCLFLISYKNFKRDFIHLFLMTIVSIALAGIGVVNENLNLGVHWLFASIFFLVFDLNLLIEAIMKRNKIIVILSATTIISLAALILGVITLLTFEVIGIISVLVYIMRLRLKTS